MNDLELDPMYSRAAIADLVHRYAYNVRRGIPQACEGLFTADMEFHVREASPLDIGTFVARSSSIGRDAVLSYIGHTGGSVSRIVPVISNLLIELDGREASGTCLMTNRVYPDGSSLSGEYQDSFRYDDGWRFSHRIFTIFVDQPS